MTTATGTLRSCRSGNTKATGQASESPADRPTDARSDARRAAARRYNQRRNEAIARGVWQGRQPLDPVHEHLVKLRAAGCSLQYIADRAGLERMTVKSLLQRRRVGWVNAPTARRILAIEPVSPTTIGWRQIEGMLALGYPKTWIASQLGRKRFDYSRRLLHPKTLRRLAELAARVGDTPGPSETCRAEARRLGYRVPAWWEEDFSTPEPVPLDDAPLLEEDLDPVDRVRLRTERGETAEEIALALGVSSRTVVRYRTMTERVAS